jgi:hypothetical protein
MDVTQELKRISQLKNENKDLEYLKQSSLPLILYGAAALANMVVGKIKRT